LVDKDERARKRSGEKKKLARKEFFESHHIRIFLSSKKVEIIRKGYRIGC